MKQLSDKLIMLFVFVLLAITSFNTILELISNYKHLFYNPFGFIVTVHIVWFLMVGIWSFFAGVNGVGNQVLYILKGGFFPYIFVIKKLILLFSLTGLVILVFFVCVIVLFVLLMTKLYQSLFVTATVFAASDMTIASSEAIKQAQLDSTIWFLVAVLFGVMPFLFLLVFIYNRILKTKIKENDDKIISFKEVRNESKRTKNQFFISKSGIFERDKFKKVKNTILVSQHLKIVPKKTFQHILIGAPTGSGKSVSFAMPVLLGIDDVSLVVTDPKGELYFNTKDILIQKGYEVYHLNFTNPSASVNYNILQNCKSPDEVRKLCESILKNGGDPQDDKWSDLAQPVFQAFVFFIWKEGGNMSDVAEKIATADLDEFDFELEGTNNAEAKTAFGEFLKTKGGDGQVAGVFGTIQKALKVFHLDNIKEIQNGHLDVSQLRRKKTVLFISYPEDESKLYSPILSPLYYQIMNVLKNDESVSEHQKNGEALPVCFLLDEFTNIGVIPQFTSFLTTVRSKKISIMIFVQSIDQLKQTYGQDNFKTIVQNCATKLCLAGTTESTAEFFSKLAGKRDVRSYSTSADGKKSFSTQTVNVIEPNEIRTMASNKVFIVADNFKAIMDDKNYYYMTRFEYLLFKHLPFLPETNEKIIMKLSNLMKKSS